MKKDMSKKRTMQIDVIEEVKGTQFMQCKLYIDGNASVILMHKIDYERLKEEGILINGQEKNGEWRWVTHKDVNREDIDRAVSSLAELLK